MTFPFVRTHQKPLTHKPILLTDPNSLIGYRIDDGHIKLISVLGIGGNGVVYHAVECCPADMPQPTNPSQFAVKALSKVGLQSNQLRHLELEFELHARVSDHPSVVTFHGIIEEEDFFFVLLDYLPEGDIFDKMEIGAYVGNDDLIKSVFLQLIDAVEYCHKLGVSHRDIKPENILCKDGGSRILLADFGLSTDRRAVQDYGLGSEPYMAPQCFGGFWKKLGPYSAAQTDVWSLGVILVNLACARNPWHKATQESPIFENFLNNPNYLLEILPISRELNHVLTRMFAIHPQARISLQELRVKVRSIKRFTLTKDELQRAVPDVNDAVMCAANAQKSVVLAPSAPHAVVARQITNLTAEDIVRLESEARAEVREAALRQEKDARHVRYSEDERPGDEDDAVALPLFLSPDFSLSSTIVAPSLIPRPHHPITPGADSILLVSMSDEANSDPDLDSDSDPDPDSDSVSDFESESESDAYSDGPITPESHPAAYGDIAAVPEINLDEHHPNVLSASVAGIETGMNLSGRKVPEARRGPRRAWWL